MLFKIALVAAVAAVATAELTQQQKARLAELLSEKSEVAGLVRQRRQALTVFDLGDQVADLSARFDVATGGADGLVAHITGTVESAIATNKELLKAVQQAQTFKDTLLDSIREADSKAQKSLGDLSASVDDQLSKAEDSLTKEQDTANSNSEKLVGKLEDFQVEVNKKLKSLEGLEKAVEDSVDKKIKPLQAEVGLLEKLSLTYLSDPQIPVFRYNVWHTYDQSYSWMDGNNGRSFGGVAPGTWTDGNGCANDMGGDLKLMQRLFIERGTADKWGASICSDVFMMYSSTDGRVCGSLWRIKNTATETVNWKPEWMYSSFDGWGEYASASINGANTFRHHCNYSWCRRSIDFAVPANPKGDRTSTIIFISTGAGNNGLAENTHQRSNFHMFNDNALQLPNGLEYVEDLDVAEGSWKE